MPAKTMYSYADTLYEILDEFKPKSIFEWGPGTSTQIMAYHPDVETVECVEHSPMFHEMISNMSIANVVVHHEPDMESYINKIGDRKFDMIFVDGRNRSECLKKAFYCSDLIVLHDAARQDYRNAIYTFIHQIWTDDGNTVVLTNSTDVYDRAKECLTGLVCGTPEPEMVVMTGDSAKRGEVF